jgi:G3E family GTPase
VVRTQAELESALAELLARSRPERIVLETTGIAEPQAIVDGLIALGGDEPAVVTSAVVTVVDADAGAEQLERHREARAQVALADRILLTKLDVAGPDRLAAVHRALDVLNPHAERVAFPAGVSATRELAAWLLDDHARVPRSLAARTDHPWGRPSHSDHQLVAAAFSDETPLLGEPLVALCHRLGPGLVRVKGFVQLAGEERRGYLERAGRDTNLRLEGPWPRGPRRTELVFIGEGLDPGSLHRQLLACRPERPRS